MKTTEFEHTIERAVADLITLLERTLDMGTVDPNVPTEILIPAVVLKAEIRNSLEKYSDSMLDLLGVKD